LTTLNALIPKLFEEMNEVRSEILDKEDKFQRLMKHMTRVLCEYDNETRNMVETLHKTRDEQVCFYISSVCILPSLPLMLFPEIAFHFE